MTYAPRNTVLVHLVVALTLASACGASAPGASSATDGVAGRIVGRADVVLFDGPTSDRAVATVPLGLEATRIGEPRAGRVPVRVGEVIQTRGWIGSDHFARGERGERAIPVTDSEAAAQIMRRYTEGNTRPRRLPAGTVLSLRGRPVATARQDAYVLVRDCAATRAEVVAVGDRGIVIAGEVDAASLCAR